MKRLYLPVTADLSIASFLQALRILLAKNDWPTELHVAETDKEIGEDIVKAIVAYPMRLCIHPTFSATPDWILRGTVFDIYSVSDKDPPNW